MLGHSVLPPHNPATGRDAVPSWSSCHHKVGQPFRWSLYHTHLHTIAELLEPICPQVVCLLAGSAPVTIHAFASSQSTSFSCWPTILISPIAQSPLRQGLHVQESHNSTQLQGPGTLPSPLSLSLYHLSCPCFSLLHSLKSLSTWASFQPLASRVGTYKD